MRTRCAIGLDLEVYYTLRVPEQCSLFGFHFYVALNDLFAFFNQPFHPCTFFPTGCDFQITAYLFNTL